MHNTNNIMNYSLAIMNEEQKKKANAILFEYFRNNRYPKKVEKLKLAERAGVTLQFVINFFYNTRSKIRSIEKQQSFNGNPNAFHYQSQGIFGLSPEASYFSQLPGFNNVNLTNQFTNRLRCIGNNNSLYKSVPIVKPQLLFDQNMKIYEELICTKIEINDQPSSENLNNFRSVY